MTTAKKLILLALALLGASLPASGALLRDLEFGSFPGTHWFDPSIGSPVARLAGGSYAVVWQGPGQEARLQWVSPDGAEVLEPGGRQFATPTDGEFPAVIANPLGGAFVAFVGATEKGARVLVQSFDATASPRWPGDGVLAVDSSGREDQRALRLLASADGGVFVCFGRSADPAPAVDQDRTVCQRLGPDGRPLWPGGRVAGSRPGHHLTPSLVTDGAGGVLVFWSTTRTLTSGGQRFSLLSVEGQHLSPDGTRLWEPRGKLLHETTRDNSFFAFSRVFAVPDGRGGAILAFGDWKRTSDDVAAQRVDRDGTLLWGSGITVAAGPRYQLLDSLTALPDGAAVVVQEVLPNSQSRLRLYRLSRGGQLRRPILGAELSAPNRNQADFGSQGSFDGDRLRILWSSHVLGNGLHVEIRIAVFDPAGRRLTAPDAPPLVAWGTDEARYFGGFAFDTGRNQGLVVWNDWLLLTTPTRTVGINAEGGLFSGDEGVP
ncbi:MAG: hypothetical protein ACJ76N_27980 [Thermoanaerobaculia bacterium]